jgi:hypothetical protein
MGQSARTFGCAKAGTAIHVVHPKSAIEHFIVTLNVAKGLLLPQGEILRFAQNERQKPITLFGVQINLQKLDTDDIIVSHIQWSDIRLPKI